MTNVLGEFFSNGISVTFSIVIFAVFLFAVVALLRGLEGRAFSGFINIAPNALTSLGILGTFTGIFVGLAEFNFDVIDKSVFDKSVLELLKGLKIAFGTSILGLFFALVLRIFILFVPPLEVSTEEDVGQEFLRHMKELVKLAKDNNKTASEGFTNLHESITNGFAEQIKEFKSFADKMSEAFSEAIIDELRDVIREFNEKISEQFGDNFKQLNEAVGKLLEWQDKYREHIETLEDKFNTAAENLEKVQQATQSIADSTASIPEHMGAYDGIMEGLKEQLTALHEGLASIAEMREKAEGAFIEISERVTEIVNTMQDSATNISESATESAKLVTDAVQEQKDNQKATLESLKDNFDDLMKETKEQLNGTIRTLDEAMQERIGTIMQEMADNLGGISQQFVRDYEPLLQASREVVELANTAKGRRS